MYMNSHKALNIMNTLLHVTSPSRGRDQMCAGPTSGNELSAINYILGIFFYKTLPAVHNKHSNTVYYHLIYIYLHIHYMLILT